MSHAVLVSKRHNYKCAQETKNERRRNRRIQRSCQFWWSPLIIRIPCRRRPLVWPPFKCRQTIHAIERKVNVDTYMSHREEECVNSKIERIVSDLIAQCNKFEDRQSFRTYFQLSHFPSKWFILFVKLTWFSWVILDLLICFRQIFTSPNDRRE